MNLNKRQPGTGGLEITTLGFGAWAIGGGGWSFGWGQQDDQASIAALRYAIALGINWADTAANYGLGHSEEVVGRALGAIPAAERRYVFTKCGLIADRSHPFEPPQRNLRPESVVALEFTRIGHDFIIPISLAVAGSISVFHLFSQCSHELVPTEESDNAWLSSPYHAIGRTPS